MVIAKKIHFILSGVRIAMTIVLKSPAFTFDLQVKFILLPVGGAQTGGSKRLHQTRKQRPWSTPPRPVADVCGEVVHTRRQANVVVNL